MTTAPHATPASADPGAATHLTPWAYRTLAMAAGAIGIAASAVTAHFFVVALEQIEADAPARDALLAAGVLMIVTELAAFFLAALLPAQQLRALRVQLLLCAGLLVAFEGATIYIGQHAMQQTAQAQASSLQTRIQQAQASLQAQQQTAAALRSNGATQSDSKYSWVRQDGAATLQRAADIEQRTAPLAQELASLQAQQRPTLAGALGHTGMLAYTVARAVLVSCMGLVMCGAAGALLRAARHSKELQPKQPVSLTTPAQPDTKTVAPAVTVAGARGRWRSVAAPLASMAMAPVAFAVPAAIAAPALLVLRSTPADIAATVAPAPTVATAAPDAPVDTRYQRLRAGVLAGHIKPSVRAMHASVGGSTLAMRDYQHRLVAEGAIERHGQGYRLCQPAQGALI